MKTSAVFTALVALLRVATAGEDSSVGIAGVLRCGNEFAPEGTEVWLFNRKSGSDRVLPEQTLSANGHFNITATKDTFDVLVVKINHNCNKSACTRKISAVVDEECRVRGGPVNKWCSLDVSTNGTQKVLKAVMGGKNVTELDLIPSFPGEECAATMLHVLAPLVLCAVALTFI
ncbi:hypothetical protein AAVH_30358 [Aphelenchoides avenae]|nr:hypothetical protein AAVH_30358 [Aphelenchus avenae]